MKARQDYKIETETKYGGRDVPIDIRKTKDNFDKDGRPKCFNCNVYRHIAKDYRKLKRE